jgi:hypothetical protein
MIGSTFNADNESEFSGKALRLDIRSSSGVAEPGKKTSVDLALTDDVLLQGIAKFVVYGGNRADTVSLQVVHPLAGVVSQFASDFFVIENKQDQEVYIPNYTAKIPAGLILRCEYSAAPIGSPREIKINWLLHKVLV